MVWISAFTRTTPVHLELMRALTSRENQFILDENIFIPLLTSYD